MLISAEKPGSGVAHSTWIWSSAKDTDAVPPIRSNVSTCAGCTVGVGSAVAVGCGAAVGVVGGDVGTGVDRGGTVGVGESGLVG